MFSIDDVERRQSVPGSWVTGWIYGFHYSALVFCDHATNPDWEIGKSRISKLQIESHRCNGMSATGAPCEVAIEYLWDRGEVMPTTGPYCQFALEFLSAYLAKLVYERPGTELVGEKPQVK